MKKFTAVSWLLVCFSTTAYAQGRAPKLLHEAAHCLAAKALPKTAALNLGYLYDAKSYPGEEVLFVVDYIGPGRSKGLVFTLFLGQQNGRQAFNIQNNAKFVIRRSSSEDVDFVDPPLGGTWTQEHLVEAIKRIEQSPIYKLHLKDLEIPSDSVLCESYADSK